MSPMLERRTVEQRVELRSSEQGGQKIGGYAIVYGKRSGNLGGFVEVVEQGFVDKTIADGADVVARTHHDDKYLLGRTRSGTLRLNSDETGLNYEVDIPDTTYGRDLAVLAERNDIRSSSFAFQVMTDGHEWAETEQGYPLRVLKRGGGRLIDVAPVVTPAYDDATAALRSLAEMRSLDYDVVREAASHNELGVLLREKEPTVIDLGGQSETHPLLAIARRRMAIAASMPRPF